MGPWPEHVPIYVAGVLLIVWVAVSLCPPAMGTVLGSDHLEFAQVLFQVKAEPRPVKRLGAATRRSVLVLFNIVWGHDLGLHGWPQPAQL